MRILAFDQSLTASAGVLLRQDTPGVLTLAQTFVLRPKSTGIYRLMDIKGWYQSVIEECYPDMMCRELHNMRQFGAAGGLQSLTTLLDILATENGLLCGRSYAVVAPGTWKKFCTGRGNLKKDTAYLMHLNKFFVSSDIINLPQDYEVQDDNIADAICIGLTGYYARRIVCGSDTDLVGKTAADALKKVAEAMFDHGKGC